MADPTSKLETTLSTIIEKSKDLLETKKKEDFLDRFAEKTKIWTTTFQQNSIDVPRIDLLTIFPNLLFRSESFRSFLKEGFFLYRDLADRRVQSFMLVEKSNQFWKKWADNVEIRHGMEGFFASLREIVFYLKESNPLMISQNQRAIVTHEIMEETRNLFNNYLEGSYSDISSFFSSSFDYVQYIISNNDFLEYFGRGSVLIQRFLNNPALIGMEESNQEMTKLIDGFRDNLLIDNVFKKANTELMVIVEKLLMRVEDLYKPSERLTEATKELAKEIFLDESGKPSLDSLQLAISHLKDTIVPLLSKNLSYFPIPKIEGSNESYEYSFNNIYLRSKDLIPGAFDFDFGSNIEIQTKKKETVNQMADFLGEFLSFARLKISDLEFHLKDVEFDFKRKVFPAIEDHGFLDIHVFGPNSKIQVYWSVHKSKEGDISFQLYKAKCVLDNLNIQVKDANHSWLLSIITTLFSGAIKLRVEKMIQRYLKEVLLTLKIEKTSVANLLPENVVSSAKSTANAVGKIYQETKENVDKDYIQPATEILKENSEFVREKLVQGKQILGEKIQEMKNSENPAQSLVQTAQVVKESVEKNLPELTEKLPQILSQTTEQVSQKIDQVVGAPVLSALSSVVEKTQISSLLPSKEKIAENIQPVVENSKEKLSEKIVETKNQVFEKMENLKDQAIEKIPGIVEKASEIVERTTDLAKEFQEKTEETLGVPLKEIVPLPPQIIEKISLAKEKVVEKIVETKDQVVENVENLKEKSKEIDPRIPGKIDQTLQEAKEEIEKKTNVDVDKMIEPLKNEKTKGKKKNKKRGNKKNKKIEQEKKVEKNEQEKSVEKNVEKTKGKKGKKGRGKKNQNNNNNNNNNNDFPYQSIPSSESPVESVKNSTEISANISHENQPGIGRVHLKKIWVPKHQEKSKEKNEEKNEEKESPASLEELQPLLGEFQEQFHEESREEKQEREISHAIEGRDNKFKLLQEESKHLREGTPSPKLVHSDKKQKKNRGLEEEKKGKDVRVNENFSLPEIPSFQTESPHLLKEKEKNEENLLEQEIQRRELGFPEKEEKEYKKEVEKMNSEGLAVRAQNPQQNLKETELLPPESQKKEEKEKLKVEVRQDRDPESEVGLPELSTEENLGKESGDKVSYAEAALSGLGDTSDLATNSSKPTEIPQEELTIPLDNTKEFPPLDISLGKHAHGHKHEKQHENIHQSPRPVQRSSS